MGKKDEERERGAGGGHGVHLPLGEHCSVRGAGAGGLGDSARHCRHRGDGAPVLPVRRPVVPVNQIKTEMLFLFGQQNNSRKYTKILGLSPQGKLAHTHLSRLLSKVAWLTITKL